MRNWRKQEEIDEGRREGLTTDEKEELRRLRRENKVRCQEKEVLRKATADSIRLHISEKTVSNHISNIFAKLQVADRAQAIIRAREAGLGQDAT